MNRRQVLGVLGGGGISVAGSLAVFEPEVIIGSPRGEGDPVSIERTITDESIEYRPATDKVRYATLMSSGEPVEYETESFEKWARRKSASVGSEAVLPAIQNRFQKEVEGVGKAASSEYIGMVITVMATTTRNREGKIVSEPNVSFEALVDATPRAVQTTITLEDRSYSRSVPVFVEETEVSYL